HSGHHEKTRSTPSAAGLRHHSDDRQSRHPRLAHCRMIRNASYVAARLHACGRRHRAAPSACARDKLGQWPCPENRLTPRQRQRRTVRRRALADALITARHEAGLPQTELAEAAGMSRSAIARLENSTASITSDALWDIAVALGMRPSALFLLAEADEAAVETLDTE